MAATKPSKARTKPRRKPKSKAERAEIKRQNARKSTRPRTAAGKNKSKYNACTHGMTARTVLLPGEDADALAARQQHLVDSFQPRNPHELAVIEAMAGDSLINIRIKGASGAFDPADVTLQDLLGAAPLGTAQLRAEARPVLKVAGDADRDERRQVFLAEVNDSGRREHDGRESRNDAPPARI